MYEQIIELTILNNNCHNCHNESLVTESNDVSSAVIYSNTVKAEDKTIILMSS